MQLSIQRLRWILLGGAVLLVGVLTAFIGYGRFRALQTYHRLLQHSGATFTHSADGFTYSQSVQGKTIFTLHALRAEQMGDGKWLLHDAVMTLFGRVAGSEDRIYASEVEYDEKQGVARAHGEVHMDLDAPESLSGSHGAPAQPPPAGAAAQPAESKVQIHVRTSGLVYLHQLGVAATDQQVEFRYGGLVCTAQGAEFNTSQSTVSLLAKVHLTGQVHAQPVDMTATHAEMDRTANIAQIAQPTLNSRGRTARADHATLRLRPDGSVERLQAEGDIRLTRASDVLTADHLDAALNEQMLPHTAVLSGSVQWIGNDPTRPLRGAAARVEASFDASGEVNRLTASGGVQMHEVDRSGVPQRGGAGLERNLRSGQVVALLSPLAAAGPATRHRTSQLTQLTATGTATEAAQASAQTYAQARGSLAQTTTVAADSLVLQMEATGAGRTEPRRLMGQGHTLLQQETPPLTPAVTAGAELRSRGQTLDLRLAETSAEDQVASPQAVHRLEVRSALQTGHVEIYDRAPTRAGHVATISNATGGRATYDGATDRLTLSQAAQVDSGRTLMQAQTIVLDRALNQTEATGDVRATLLPDDAASTASTGTAASSRPSSSDPAEATHVLAQSAHLDNATRVAVFRGTDAEPARLWQRASQVQAALLTLNGSEHSFRARPLSPAARVHAVFASEPGPGAKGRAQAMRVSSAAMDYTDLHREGVFVGDVQMEGSAGAAQAERGEVYLVAAHSSSTAHGTSADLPLQGSLDRILLLGQVRLVQPGRVATGQQLEYTAADRSFVLTGSPTDPPRVEDALQGNVTGARLTFSDAGSTIVVVGQPATASTHRGRVRTETELHPQH